MHRLPSHASFLSHLPPPRRRFAIVPGRFGANFALRGNRPVLGRLARAFADERTLVLATLFAALTLCLHPPVMAQSTGPDSASTQIEAMVHAHASAAHTATAQAFDTALQDYELCHWPAAFEQLVRLAEQDHVQAARMAMQMVRHGPSLFGQTFALSPDQMERFTRLRWQAPLAHATSAR